MDSNGYIKCDKNTNCEQIISNSLFINNDAIYWWFNIYAFM